MIINKKVKLNLLSLNGNAFSLMSAFQNAAKREGWTKEEIGSVIEVCMNGDYDNLVTTLKDHCNA